jgi:hypothetical protein
MGAHRRSRGCGRARKAAAVACISGARVEEREACLRERDRPPRGKEERRGRIG